MLYNRLTKRRVARMEVAAFWIGLAAVLVAGIWRKKHAEQVRQETLRLLIQKDGTLSPDVLKELLNPKPPEWNPQTLALMGMKKWEPGESRRIMRLWGSILMIAGPGVGCAIAAIGLTRALGFNTEMSAGDSASLIAAGIGLTIVLVLLGLALYYASGFLRAGPEGEAGSRRNI